MRTFLSTPTLLALRRQVGADPRRAEHLPILTGQLCDHRRRRRGESRLPDVRAQGRRPDAAGQRPDHQGRNGPARALPGGLARIDTTASTQNFVVLSKSAWNHQVVVDNNQIVVLDELIGGPPDGRHRQGATLRRACPGRRAVPLRRAQPHEANLLRLPQADGRTHQLGRPRPQPPAVRLPHGRAGPVGLAQRLFWNDETRHDPRRRRDAGHAASGSAAATRRPSATGGYWVPPKPAPDAKR